MNPAGAIAALKAFTEATRGNVVSADEISRREKICRTCPKREVVKESRSAVSERLGMLANKHRVPESVRGYCCGVCKCSLMLLLPATQKDLHTDSREEEKQRPASCWLKQEKQK